jgi:hypothetical protein
MNMKNRTQIIVGIAALVAIAVVGWMRAGSDSADVQPRIDARAAAPRAAKAEESVFALQAADTAHDAVHVTMRSLPTSGPVVTIITQLDYDSARLKMKSCDISPEIGAGSKAAKVLHLAEPQPGLVRAVVAGTLEELPKAGDVLACDFTVQPNAPAGPTTLRIHGDVADMTFEDRAFSTEKTIVIRN